MSKVCFSIKHFSKFNLLKNDKEISIISAAIFFIFSNLIMLVKLLVNVDDNLIVCWIINYQIWLFNEKTSAFVFDIFVFYDWDFFLSRKNKAFLFPFIKRCDIYIKHLVFSVYTVVNRCRSFNITILVFYKIQLFKVFN